MKALPVFLLLTALAALPAGAQTTETIVKHHMVAAANPHAAQAGLDMLRAGGTAVDAAIATQMVLGLVEPESSGIGGGAFMLVYDGKSRKTTSFDGREMAPQSATPGMFLGSDGKPRAHFDAIPGGLSVGIPGVVRMLYLAHQKYGKLPWARLFQPAIKLAEDGFPVGPKLARTIQGFAPGARMPDIRAHFYHPDGTPLQEGEIFKNPEYAAALKKIAARGPDGFYRPDSRGNHRRDPARPRPAGRHDLGRSGQLSRCGARAGVRRVPRLSYLLHGPAQFRRHCGAPDIG